MTNALLTYRYLAVSLKGKGNVFLHGNFICRYTLSEYALYSKHKKLVNKQYMLR